MGIKALAGPLSIRTRLSLFYTVVAVAAMGLFALAVDWQLVANFRSEHERFLEAKAAELHSDLAENASNPALLLAEIAKETAGTSLRQYEARVVDAAGNTLGETPNMRRTIPSSVFPAATPTGLIGTEAFRVDGRIYTLDSVVLAQGTKAISVQIALDVTRDAILLRNFERAMVLALLLFAPLLAFVGRWVSGRGLAPLARITEAAREITPAQLSRRISTAPPWPSELAGLVAVFNEMLDRMDEAFARLSRFSADLAHELRTPLGNLSGELEVCLMRPRGIEEYRAALESGLEECRRLNNLIENLLFIARAENAGLVLHKEHFDVAQACDWAAAQLAAGAETRGVRIRVEGVAEIDADPILFRQALTNLLSNAVRHAPAGTDVNVTVSRGSQDGVTISVHNMGEPIPPNHLPHIFDRFYQVDEARQHAAGQGTGLGLSIVKTIVELHQGSVAITSSAEAGTTASMWIPGAKLPK